jgi:hypothetical protein
LFGTLAEGAGQVACDARLGLRAGSAAEERHHEERVVTPKKKVYQAVLMHPVDLAEQAPDTRAVDAAGDGAPRRKPDLERYVVPNNLRVDGAEEQPDAPCSHRSYVVAIPVKERPD